LNGTFDEAVGEQLVLNVLQTLTELLAGNDESKVINALHFFKVHFTHVQYKPCGTRNSFWSFLDGHLCHPLVPRF
jgi:hypothetical protein